MSLDETPHAGSRRKLDELFVHWLSLPDTQQALRALVEDVRAGREVDLTSTRSSASFAGAATGRGSRAKLPVSPSRAAASHFSYGECHAHRAGRGAVLLVMRKHSRITYCCCGCAGGGVDFVAAGRDSALWVRGAHHQPRARI